MRRVRLALPLISVAVSALASPSTHAAIRNNEVVITGRVLYAMCTYADAEIERDCATFIRGFVDGARSATEMSAARPFFCLPETAGTDLVVLAFTQQVERLPRTSMDDTAANVLRNALWLAFPCSATR
jgi:hypothetical protein